MQELVVAVSERFQLIYRLTR